MNASLGAFVEKTRFDKGLSQRDLARLAGCSNAEISRLEHDDYKNPTIALLEKVAYALGVPLVVLIQMAGYNLGLEGLEVAGASDNPIVQLPIIRTTSSLVTPLVQEANVVGYAAVDRDHLDGDANDHFLVRVTDDSMEGVGMTPNVSLVLTRKQFTAEHGDIALVAVGSEAATFRYVGYAGDRIVLTATNPSVRPRMAPRVTAHILGVAVEVITYTRITKMKEE
ncbi:MAG: S24 family peptidase [Clostridia bacterium]|nr:S24 family peptidase [Clostridia bacterium]